MGCPVKSSMEVVRFCAGHRVPWFFVLDFPPHSRIASRERGR